MYLAITLIALISISALAFVYWQRQRTLQREAYIRHFAFPKGVFSKVIEHHPQLSQRDMELVSRGLRQFFLAYHHGGHRYVSMPSQIADDLWHEFILYTRHYDAFCRQAFGRFLHHTPAVVLKQSRLGNEGLRRCWRYSCQEENINPRKPSRLPLLFALDSKYHVPNGFVYIADCNGVRRDGASREDGSTVYCGGDFSDNSLDGSTAGLSDTGSDPGGSYSHSSSPGEGDNGSGNGSGSESGGASDGSSCGGGSCGGGCGGD